MFDLKVQHRDSKSGRIKHVSPYRLHVVSSKSYFERPVGSGNLFWQGGEPAGQIVWENDGKKKVIKEGMAHTDYSRPLTVNEEMQREFDGRGSKIANLEAKIEELEQAQIKADAAEAVEKVEVSAKPAPLKVQKGK